MKFYLRYMDDSIIIHKSKELLEEYRAKIENKLKDLGFELNTKKTKIYRIDKEIPFLGFTHRLTKTGKIVILVKSESVRREKTC